MQTLSFGNACKNSDLVPFSFDWGFCTSFVWECVDVNESWWSIANKCNYHHLSTSFLWARSGSFDPVFIGMYLLRERERGNCIRPFFKYVLSFYRFGAWFTAFMGKYFLYYLVSFNFFCKWTVFGFTLPRNISRYSKIP